MRPRHVQWSLGVVVLGGLGALGWVYSFGGIVGGPYFGPTDMAPRFGPAYWKRPCIGFTWTDQQPDGAWLRCVGLPSGRPMAYRRLEDATPWAARPVGATLQGHDIWSEIRPGHYRKTAVLAWRRHLFAEEVLVAAEATDGRWLLARVYRHSDSPQGTWRIPFVYHEPMVGIAEYDHPPSDIELDAFITMSWWATMGVSERVLEWSLNPDAWILVPGGGQSTALTKEVERLKSYRLPL